MYRKLKKGLLYVVRLLVVVFGRLVGDYILHNV